MKTYTKTYLKHFGYGLTDYVPCEVCGSKAVDIHHIFARSIRKDLENDITNLMALCRICHQEYGDKKQWREMLIQKHEDRLKAVISK